MQRAHMEEPSEEAERRREEQETLERYVASASALETLASMQRLDRRGKRAEPRALEEPQAPAAAAEEEEAACNAQDA